MFGQGMFRPMMGELRLNIPSAPGGLGSMGQAPAAPAPSTPVQGPVSTAPVVQTPIPAPAQTSGVDHGTQVLWAGALAGLAILGSIFLTD